MGQVAQPECSVAGSFARSASGRILKAGLESMGLHIAILLDFHTKP